jgi:hypothetical protein
MAPWLTTRVKVLMVLSALALALFLWDSRQPRSPRPQAAGAEPSGSVAGKLLQISPGLQQLLGTETKSAPKPILSEDKRRVLEERAAAPGDEIRSAWRLRDSRASPRSAPASRRICMCRGLSGTQPGCTQSSTIRWSESEMKWTGSGSSPSNGIGSRSPRETSDRSSGWANETPAGRTAGSPFL